MTQLTLTGFKPTENKIIDFPFQGRPVPLKTNTQTPKPVTEVLTVNKPIIDKEYKESSHQEHNPTDAYTPEEIQIMLNYLWNTPSRYKGTNIRNYLYIALSVNLSRRASDILPLRVQDVLTENGEIRTHIYFDEEQKTGKSSRIYINTHLQKALVKYFNLKGTYTMSEYLFPKYTSQEEHNTVPGMRIMLKRLAKKLIKLHPEYKEQGLFAKHYGTHSLRKTLPSNVFNTSTEQQDITMTQHHLRHVSLKDTRRYLNIQQKEYDSYIERFGIGEEN